VRRLFALADIPASDCKEFALQPGAEVDCFVVRHQGSLRAYRNHCPHTGAPLNWQPDVFLDYTGETIQCALHGALFRIEDGACLYGPCSGQALQSITVRVEDEAVWLCHEELLTRE